MYLTYKNQLRFFKFKTLSMKKYRLLIVFVIVLILWYFSYILFFRWPRICSHDKCFSIEIADTFSERELWLMYRTYMNPNHWMLFVFDTPEVSNFWMKNTLIPLDIIRMDWSGKIIYIQDSAPSCNQEPCNVYWPNKSAKYVLELNWWTANKKWIKVGDRLFIK
jgi:uncharacterized membrane protein (UPF0127 family)